MRQELVEQEQVKAAVAGAHPGRDAFVGGFDELATVLPRLPEFI